MPILNNHIRTIEMYSHVCILISMVVQYYVWLTAPKSDFFNELSGALLKRGYTVSPMGRSGILSYVDKPAHIISLAVHRTPKSPEEEADYTPTGVHDEVMDVIRALKIRIYSIIVSQASACTWNTGNMSIAQMEMEELQKKGMIN